MKYSCNMLLCLMNVRRSHVICHFHHEFDPVFESLIIKPVSVPQIVYSSHCKFYSLLLNLLIILITFLCIMLFSLIATSTCRYFNNSVHPLYEQNLFFQFINTYGFSWTIFLAQKNIFILFSWFSQSILDVGQIFAAFALTRFLSLFLVKLRYIVIIQDYNHTEVYSISFYSSFHFK